MTCPLHPGVRVALGVFVQRQCSASRQCCAYDEVERHHEPELLAASHVETRKRSDKHHREHARLCQFDIGGRVFAYRWRGTLGYLFYRRGFSAQALKGRSNSRPLSERYRSFRRWKVLEHAVNAPSSDTPILQPHRWVAGSPTCAYA